MKRCPKCKINKIETEFFKELSRKDGLRGLCKDCDRNNHRAYDKTKKGIDSRLKRENKRKPRKGYWFLQKYGIDLKEKQRIYEEQNRLCDICKIALLTVESSCIDHDHSDGKIRGILCRNCNSGLGMFMDSSELLKCAIDYLNKYKKAK